MLIGPAGSGKVQLIKVSLLDVLLLSISFFFHNTITLSPRVLVSCVDVLFSLFTAAHSLTKEPWLGYLKGWLKMAAGFASLMYTPFLPPLSPLSLR